MELVLYKRALRDRLVDEFNNHISPSLRTLILFTAAVSANLHKKKPTIVTLGRTVEEQDEIYGKNPTYIKNPWKSYHQTWMAVDFRFAPFTFSEWAEMLTIIEAVYKPHGFECIVHTPEVSPAPHVHMEIHTLFLT